MEKSKPKVGQLLRGQAWVELCGVFTSDHLRAIADEIEKNCKGLEKKDVNQTRHSYKLGSVPSDN